MTVEAIICSVLVDNPRCRVFSVNFSDGTIPICRDLIGAMPRSPAAGEVWSFELEPTYDMVHGRQLNVQSAVLCRSSANHLATFLGRHPSFRNIGLGPARLAALITAHGRDAKDVIARGDVATLSTIMPADTAALLVDRWSEVAAEADLMDWMSQHGINPKHAMKCIRLLGRDCRSTIEANPYILATLDSWPAVDSLGLQLGVSPQDPRRVVGAVKSVFRSVIDQGDTSADHGWIDLRTRELLGEEIAGPGDLAVVHEAAFSHAGKLQPAGAWRMERSIETRVRSMLENPLRPSASTLALLESLPPHLTCEQRRAVAMAMQHRFSCLVGGAGVGKTSTLQAIVDLAEQAGIPVTQVAPTGKAAQRIRIATGRSARTIAATLHASSETPIPEGSLVLCDEASMVDLPTFYRLLDMMPTSASALLIGDTGQLPPVGFGLVFHRLASSAIVPRTLLSIVHRQRAITGIPAAAEAIREGKVPALQRYVGAVDGVYFMETADPSAPIQIWKDLSTAGPCQVLAARRNTVDRLNAEIQNARGGTPIRLLHGRFRENDPIGCLRNDYDLGLWNGSLGTVRGARVSEGTVVMDAVVDGEEHEIPARYFSEIDLAYAITTHRSQGSAFERVVVVLEDCRIADRAWLYTAVTRSERQVVLVGTAKTLNAIVEAPPSAARRCVGFAV